MDRLLRLLLRSLIQRGTLRVTTSRGTELVCGDGTGEVIAIRFLTPDAERAVILDPELAVGEAYIDGALLIERGTLADFLDLAVSNMAQLPRNRWTRFIEWGRSIVRRAMRLNTTRRAKDNASHHYDIDERIYRLFLDPDMQYSCAYFEHDGDSLEEAQVAKRRHIAAKLVLDEGGKPLRVLDIGSGWGGLALYLARNPNVSVIGINPSEGQLKVARERVGQAGPAVAGRVEFRKADYREVEDRFDRIVSVGMFEHVGREFYDVFFATCHRLLDEDGVMLLHTVGRLDGPSETNPWVQKYIFPGGYAPALSELAESIERSKLLMNDVEILRLHYAHTLRAWRMAFDARLPDVRKVFASDADLTNRFGSVDRFIRMWDFYLAGFEQFFKYHRLCVFQVQLTKKIDRLPLTRSYMYDRPREQRRGSLQAAE